MSTSTQPPNVASATPENPWLGLRFFEESDQRFFFGREREVAQLFRLVQREVASVLFGQSGLGKSSILNAGLFPRLRRRGFFPVRVTFDYGDGDDAESPTLLEQTRRQIEHALSLRGIQTERDEDAPLAEDETLWEYYQNTRFWDGARLVTPVIVFDQFEEIFKRGPTSPRALASTQEFVEELADLIENRIPESVQQRIRSADLPGFSARAPRVKIVLSLREDYLADLEELVPGIPSLSGRVRYRLGPMAGDQALDAIREPAEEKQLLEEGVAEKILDAIRESRRRTSSRFLPFVRDRSRTIEVEPFLLSLFCRELNELRDPRRRGGKAGARKLTRITADLVESHQRGILRHFYESCLRDLPNAEKVQTFVEDRLVGETGYRELVSTERAKREFEISPSTLDKLVERRLLRRDERRGVVHVELAHDVLVDEIVESRRRRRLRARQKAWLRQAFLWSTIAVFAATLIGVRLFLLVFERDVRVSDDHYTSRESRSVAVDTSKLELPDGADVSAYTWSSALGGVGTLGLKGNYLTGRILNVGESEASRVLTLLGRKVGIFETEVLRLPVSVIFDDDSPTVSPDEITFANQGGVLRDPAKFAAEERVRIRHSARLGVVVTDASPCRVELRRAGSEEVVMTASLATADEADVSQRSDDAAGPGDEGSGTAEFRGEQVRRYQFNLQELANSAPLPPGPIDLEIYVEDAAGHSAELIPLSLTIDNGPELSADPQTDPPLFGAGRAFLPVRVAAGELLQTVSFNIDSDQGEISEPAVFYAREQIEEWRRNRWSGADATGFDALSAVTDPALLEHTTNYCLAVPLAPPPNGAQTWTLKLHVRDNSFPSKLGEPEFTFGLPPGFDLSPSGADDYPFESVRAGTTFLGADEYAYSDSGPGPARLGPIQATLAANCDFVEIRVGADGDPQRGAVAGDDVKFDELELQPDARNEVTIRVADLLGRTFEKTWTIRPDRAPPSIDLIVRPAEQNDTTNRVRYVFEVAADEPVAQATLQATWRVDSEERRSSFPPTPENSLVFEPVLSERDYTLTCTAKDAVGNSGEAVVAVSVNPRGPRVTTMSGQDFVEPDAVTGVVRLRAEDGNGIDVDGASIEFRVSHGKGRGLTVTASGRLERGSILEVTPDEPLPIPSRGSIEIKLRDSPADGNSLETTTSLPYVLEPNWRPCVEWPQGSGLSWIFVESFYILQTEVSNESFAAAVAGGVVRAPKYFRPNGTVRYERAGRPIDGARYPVVGVEPDDALAFAKTIDPGARLPWWDEWLDAARRDNPYDDHPGKSDDDWDGVNFRSRSRPSNQARERDERTDRILAREPLPCFHVPVDYGLGGHAPGSPRCSEPGVHRLLHQLGNVQEIVRRNGSESEPAYGVVGGFYDSNLDVILRPGRRPRPYRAAAHRSFTTGFRLVIDPEKASEAFKREARKETNRETADEAPGGEETRDGR